MQTLSQLNYKKITRLLLLLPMLLLTACAQKLPESKPCPQPVIPALSAAAQPPQPIDLCLPNCLEGLTQQRNEWLNMLKKIE